MNKIAVAIAFLFIANGAYAQGRKSLKDIDKELKQTKSTATAIVLIESIADTPPQTEEEVVVLGQFMDKFPEQGQKALAGIKDPKLAKAVIKELTRQHDKLKSLRTKDERTATDKDRQEYSDSYMNSEALIQTLVKLNSKEAIPVLRTYLDDKALSHPASLALGHLGDDASLDTMLGAIEKDKNMDVSGYGDKAFAKVIAELDKPGITAARKAALINQIKGSKSSYRKKALKELALNHKDEDVRNRSGQALINAMILNPEEGDSDVLYEWVPKAVYDLDAVWSLTTMRIYFPDKNRPLERRFVPALLDVLNKSPYGCSRSKAAELLGSCKIKESLPYLEDCIVKDKDSTVRGSCRHGYWEITGIVPVKFHPEDVDEREEYYKRPDTIKFLNWEQANHPDHNYNLDSKRAFDEYKRPQK